MCIRDREHLDPEPRSFEVRGGFSNGNGFSEQLYSSERAPACLLYTSDAADERSSVDLGGRRIIKKKNKRTLGQEECSRIKDIYQESTRTAY